MIISRREIISDGGKSVVRIESKRYKNCVNYKVKKHTTEVKWWLVIGGRANVFNTKSEAMLRFRSGDMGKSNIIPKRYRAQITFSGAIG